MAKRCLTVFLVTCALGVFWSGGYGRSGIARAPDKGRTGSADAYVNEEGEFRSARPLWPEGRETEMNLFVGFRAAFDRPKRGRTVLRVTGSSVYRIFLNGEFAGYGPARGPHGWYRVDKWQLRDLCAGKNVVAIEAAGYNVNSYYLVDEPAFIQAEVTTDGKVLASTAGKGVAFEACILKERLQKVQRYSFQRPFIEYYRLKPGYSRWRKDESAPFAKAECATVSAKKLLARRIEYPRFLRRQPVWCVSRGRVQTDVQVDELWKGRELTKIGPKLKGYKEEELEVVPSIELQKIKSVERMGVNEPYSPREAINLKDGSFAIVDLGTNLTGFIGARVKCDRKTRLFLMFDEILSAGDVDFKRLRCVNAVCYELEPGEYSLESFEPYTMRYLKLTVLEGDCEIRDVYLRQYANAEASRGQFSCSDRRLNEIFEAARETFRQNAVDVFMDCPSRERAGWLCDSFFASRVAFDLCGNTTIEKNFFENYLLPEGFKHLPKGMLPMCYPADHYNGRFIPNWAMWFVIQLEEYLERSGDRRLADALKPKVMSLLKYFERFKNEDGLLEDLESWVFVEWSAANQFVQDVSYPSNMLYAAVLESAGRMYGQPELVRQAEQMREVIRRQSFDGEFFVDNAVRKEGRLEVTDNRTEVCQYFAFFFGVANRDTHRQLWEKLRDEFGPKRAQTKAYPEVHAANAFVGNYLRLELLSRFGKCRQLKDEMVDYFLYMAQRTGTLWENTGTSASCNHGFASHVAHCLYRDVLGVRRVDTQNKVVQLRFDDVGLEWCEGKTPTVDGLIRVRWRREGDRIVYQAEVPAGYMLNVENVTGLRLLPTP